jgi:hypothetical protein
VQLEIVTRDFPISIRVWATGARAEDRWKFVLGFGELKVPCA